MAGFANKVFIVTGASSGIGQEVARQLLQAGARVVAMARTEHKLEELRSAARNPEDLVAFAGDVTREEDCQGVVEAALERFGTLDGLIHSAGITMRGLVAETRMEVFRQLMETNYFSTIALIQAALPVLRTTKGHVVVISSIVGYVSTPYRSGYAASKHAVQALMNALRVEEHDHGVHVLTVCPGFVRTNISLNALTASGDRHARMDTSTDEGLDPGPVAAEILAGIEHRKREIYPAGSLEKLSFYLARFAPPMLDRMLLKRFRTPGGFA